MSALPCTPPRLWPLAVSVALAWAGLVPAQVSTATHLAEERLRLPAGLPAAVDAVIADLDGDGLMDLLRASERGVHVLLQRASGRYELHPARPLMPFAGGVRSLALGRLRPGGITPDLIVVQNGAPPSVWWNDGTGAFLAAPFLLPAPIAPVAQAIAFDFDHVPPDEILMVPDQGRAQILVGQLDGSHLDAPGLLNPNLILQSPRMAIIDADGDGDDDIVVASPVQTVPFVLDNGLGGFLQQRPLPVRGAYTAVAVGDLDGDRRDDLVLARASPLPASLDFLLLSNGSLVQHALPTPFTLDAAALRVVIADTNGDGANDVLVLQADGRLRIGLSNGLPRFDMTMTLAPLATAPRSCLAVGDTDLDGDIDVFAGGGRSGTTVVRDSFLLGRGRGAAFVDTEAISFPIGALGTTPTAGAAVDHDGDGDFDLVTFGDSGGVLYADPRGAARFVERNGAIAAINLRGITRVSRATFDTPDRDLLVVADAANGSATPPGLRLMVLQAGVYRDLSARLPAVAQQGLLDVASIRGILANSLPRSVDDIVIADTVRGLTLLAHSGTTFAETPGAFSPALPSEPVQRILVGDLNGDRRADAVVLGFGARGLTIDVYLRSTTNTPPLFTALPTAAPAASLGLASAVLEDLDGDSDLDLLVALRGAVTQPLLLLVNDGTGRLVDRSAVRLPASLPAPIDHVVVLQARGAPPVILLGAEQGAALWTLAGDVLGNFSGAAMQPIHGSTRVRGFVVEDFDTDGDDDCVVLVEGAHPSLLLGADLQLTQAGLASAGRVLHMRMRGPAPTAIAAWFWSPVGPTRFVTPDWGVLRLAAPLTSLAVFPFGPTRTQDVQFSMPPSAVDVTLFFQLAVFDPRTASLRLSNLEPTVLIGN